MKPDRSCSIYRCYRNCRLLAIALRILGKFAIFPVDNVIGYVEDAIVVGDDEDRAASLFGEGSHEFHNFATRPNLS
jgi:hypothetical protein